MHQDKEKQPIFSLFLILSRIHTVTIFGERGIMAKPIRALELHYPIIQFLVISGIPFIPLYSLFLSFFVKMTIRRMRKSTDQMNFEVLAQNITYFCIL